MPIRQLHIGFGAFARAHTVLYTDLAAQAAGESWPVAVARLNSGAAGLTALDHAGGYTVAEVDDTGARPHRVTSIARTIHPQRDGADALPDLIASADLSVITLTITEKGYGLAGGTLDPSRADVAHDLAHPAAPRTAMGVLTLGLARRKQAQQGGLTVLSCDNLPGNGALTRHAVLAHAAAHDAAHSDDLASWIERNCTFPSTMVDRIVPAMTDDSHQHLTRIIGVPDPGGILCEPFRQWVIEDRFAAARPPWQDAGAQIVPNVAPFEEMKLRMLNGAHSFLAYLGSLAGVETVAACMSDPVLRDGARALMIREQAPTLSVPGVDLAGYAEALIARFANSQLHHRTGQIACDGSQKLPQRLLAPLADNLRAGRPAPLAALAIAGWMQVARDQGAALTDPMADHIAQRARAADPVDRLTELTAIFDPAILAVPGVLDAIRHAHDTLSQHGPRAAISAHI